MTTTCDIAGAEKLRENSTAQAEGTTDSPPTLAAPPAADRRSRGGAPAGNLNALRHGLTCGADPESYVTRLMTSFRQNIEAAVLAALGSITVAAASEIQAATEWERHRLKVRRWLKEAADTLTVDQKVNLSREAARAATERTKHLKALCIGSPAKRSLWATLDAKAREIESRTNGHATADAEPQATAPP
jgi:hypothetical protein